MNNSLAFSEVNAFQNGVINRASRSIIASRELDDISNVLVTCFETLSLTGCGKIEYLGKRKSLSFGGKLTKSQCLEISCFRQCSDKVSAQENYIYVNTKNILIVVSTADKYDLESDLLQDNVVVLADMIQHWIENRIEQKKIEDELKEERINTAKKIEGVSACMDRISKHISDVFHDSARDLLSDLSSKFPSMGLEADQEDYILDIVCKSVDKQRDALLIQDVYNKDLRDILRNTIGILKKDLVSSTKNNVADIQAVELF